MSDHLDNEKIEVTPEMEALLAKACQNSPEGAVAKQELAKALEEPLREGILSGDIVAPLFQTVSRPPGTSTEYALHFIAPGTESEYRAYTMPSHGAVPQFKVEGDYVTVPTYKIAADISTNIEYLENAGWDVLSDMTMALRAMFTKKNNDDGIHTLLGAAVDRNILVFDPDAAANQFTKRLVSLMKLVMRRNGGGNSTSLNRTRLTDILMSPEGMEDIRSWNVDQVDEITRREIFVAADGSINRIFSVNLHDIDEFGDNQEYQLYYENDLGGAIPAGDSEIVLGLDLTANNRKPVRMVRKNLELFDDPAVHRRGEMSMYGWMSGGWLVQDGRVVLVGSF